MESPSEVVAIIGHAQVILPGRMFGCADNLPLFAHDVSLLPKSRRRGELLPPPAARQRHGPAAAPRWYVTALFSKPGISSSIGDCTNVKHSEILKTGRTLK